MNREELKLSFEKEFKNIQVSDELKSKTLNTITNKNNVFHFPYWAKSCAAIFVVTCLCLCVYLANNNELFSKKSENIQNTAEDNSNIKSFAPDSTAFDSVKQSAPIITRSAPTPLYKTEKIIEDSGAYEDSISKNDFSTMNFFSAYSVEEYRTDSLTEEEFLIKYPDAKKTEDGYLIVENNIETLYKLENGIMYKK